MAHARARGTRLRSMPVVRGLWFVVRGHTRGLCCWNDRRVHDLQS
jgi:hypothetical protein